MSWENMIPDEKPCRCGKGTITYITEMDDWNRVRSTKIINCPECREKDRIRFEEDKAKEKKRKSLHNQAEKIAESRYLDKWLDMYEGLNKKEAWQLCTCGTGSPTLGTFYKHVKEEGVASYMRRHFLDHFEEALDKMKVKDHEIQKLLHEKKRI